MEGENEYNEFIESGKIAQSKSNYSSTNHVVVKHSSSRKIRQRNVTTVNRKKLFGTEDSSHDVSKTVADVASDTTTNNRNVKNTLMNGFQSSEKTVINSSEENGSVTQDKERYRSAKNTWSSAASSARRGAYEIYKAAGDWWNVFPKTDYTYSKSSTCRREIAPGVILMPNMSRPSLRRSRDAETSRTSVTPSRFYRSDDFISDDEDQHYTSSSSSVSETKTSVITRTFVSIWTFISRLFTAFTLREHHLGLQTPPPVRHRRAQRKPWYHKLEVLYYKSACYFLHLDVWFLSLFRRSQVDSYTEANGRKHSKYLFLLLIPPLILAGLWFASALADSETSLTPSTVLPSSVFSGESWSFLKAENFMFTHEEPLLENGGDLNTVVQKLLSSSEFKNIILLQDQKRKQEFLEREQMLVASIRQEQERLKSELEEKSEILLKQQAIYEELQRENSDMKRQLIDLGVSLKDKLSTASTSNYQQWMPHFRRVENQLKTLQADHLYLTRRIEECCKSGPAAFPSVAIEEHVTTFLSGLFDFDTRGEARTPENLKLWVKRLFEAKEDLEERLANITQNLNIKLDEVSEKSAATIMASVSEQMKQEFMKRDTKYQEENSYYLRSHVEQHSISSCGNCTLSLEKVKEIVENALNLYDADKTGMVDYALESGGGTVINTRCTENYDARSPAVSILGFFLPWSYNHPRIAIQPEIQPGKCWAFRGAWGYLVIKLTTTIKISAFSMDHIPRSLSPTGNIDSAPKNFSVWGLASENDKDPLLLGKYMFDEYGPSLQMFPVQNKQAPPYQIIELRIESNHGNLDYTCLYRFRVHGVPVTKG